jgi:hypothetical protein
MRDHHRNHKHSACEGKNRNCRSVKLVWLAHRSQLYAISHTTTTRIVAAPAVARCFFISSLMRDRLPVMRGLRALRFVEPPPAFSLA